MSFLAAFIACVLPHVRAFPGPGSVVVLDNSSLHHDQKGVLKMLVEARGGRLLYLPPYSPELMPLEQGFGAVNRFLRARAEEYAEEPQRLLDEAFRSVGATQALGYIGHMYTGLRAVDPTLS